jgi:hypothetical protein
MVHLLRPPKASLTLNVLEVGRGSYGKRTSKL